VVYCIEKELIFSNQRPRTIAVGLIQCSWAIHMLIRKLKGAMCESRIACNTFLLIYGITVICLSSVLDAEQIL